MCADADERKEEGREERGRKEGWVERMGGCNLSFVALR